MANNKKIGLYFGTFNPIHIGHLVIANHMVNYTNLDEVWFVVSPLNPFKKKKTLLDNYARLELVYRAIKGFDKLRVSDIEFGLPWISSRSILNVITPSGSVPVII